MQEKLTLRLNKNIVRHAKMVAQKRGKSVSRMVEDYFALFKEETEPDVRQLTPIVRSLKGSLRGAEAEIRDYHRHIEEKYLP